VGLKKDDVQKIQRYCCVECEIKKGPDTIQDQAPEVKQELSGYGRPCLPLDPDDAELQLVGVKSKRLDEVRFLGEKTKHDGDGKIAQGVKSRKGDDEVKIEDLEIKVEPKVGGMDTEN